MRGFPEVEFAYLYGSFLHRKRFEDVDVAVSLSQRSRGRWDSIATQVASRLEKIFKKECDLHILQEAPDHLRYRIISDGKEIFVRDKIRKIRFEAGALTNFLDFKPMYDWHNERIIARDSPW